MKFDASTFKNQIWLMIFIKQKYFVSIAEFWSDRISDKEAWNSMSWLKNTGYLSL